MPQPCPVCDLFFSKRFFFKILYTKIKEESSTSLGWMAFIPPFPNIMFTWLIILIFVSMWDIFSFNFSSQLKTNQVSIFNFYNSLVRGQGIQQIPLARLKNLLAEQKKNKKYFAIINFKIYWHHDHDHTSIYSYDFSQVSSSSDSATFLGEAKQEPALNIIRWVIHVILYRRSSKESIIRFWRLFWVSVLRIAVFSCFIWLKSRSHSAVHGLKTLIISRMRTSLSYLCGLLANISS